MRLFKEYLEGYKTKGIDYLRRNVPEIQRLESFEKFENLRFVSGRDLGDILIIEYEARAPSLFPAVRQRLIDEGIAKRHNMLHTSLGNELYNVTMGFFGNSLQISLNVCK